MRKFQSLRVQSLPLKATQQRVQCLRAACNLSAPAAVERVADHRKPRMCQMHPDLVGASGLQLYPQQSVGAKALLDPIVSNRYAAVVAYRHARANSAMPPDRLIDA